MIFGVTGPRGGVTPMQRLWLYARLGDEGVTTLHHGACVGADEAAHHAAIQLDVRVVVHPPVDKKLAMPVEQLLAAGNVIVLPDQPYHVRNRAIVRSCDELIAFPDGPPRPHSGTWNTIDYATGKVPVTICYPDGTLEERRTDDVGLW